MLWCSAATWCATGYGLPARYLLPRLQALGYDVAHYAWYGLKGSKVNFDGIDVYPHIEGQWHCAFATEHVQDCGADVALAMIDVWALPEWWLDDLGVPLIAWFPVDHEPVPDFVVEKARRCAYPATYSQHGQRALQEVGVPVTYIPLGVDTTVYRPGDRAAARRKLGLPEDSYIAAMVAANVTYPARKSYPEAMMAFARFVDAHPEMDCYLYVHCEWTNAQGGVDIPQLAQRLGIADRMKYVNRYQRYLGLPASYLAAVYNAADVLLAPSMAEGFGIPIIEAQACGTPVVTTDFVSMTELTVNGIACEPLQPFWTHLNSWVTVASVERVYQAMESIHDWTADERAANTARGVAHVQEHYDWDVLVDRYWRPFLAGVAHDLKEV